MNDKLAQVRTTNKDFLTEIDRIVPWEEWIASLQPCVFRFLRSQIQHQVPDGETPGRFRNLLLCNNRKQRLFAPVVELLAQWGLLLKKGTIADATFIESLSSAKKKK